MIPGESPLTRMFMVAHCGVRALTSANMAVLLTAYGIICCKVQRSDVDVKGT